MSSENVNQRQIAAVAGHLGDEATARPLLGHPDPDVRATALGALARMNSVTENDLNAAMLDTSPVMRRRACALAIQHLDVDLLGVLSDDQDTVAEQAAWALGERASNAGVAAVDALSIMAATHADPLCREAAVAALGAIGDTRGLEAILHGTTDKPAIRRRAVLALAPFDGPRVDAALERARDDRDWQVRQAAEDLTSQ